ncbi:zinc-dependent alcohol dehydrogenase family protein [Ottowia sp.]|uniref:zinc-dependent alcohol dehydrogenase family protein n=1 Tax=Ottowia sp. TaxID=1898956 RepID=UPI0025F349CD|nr:zinc-dependent alcohol dehydrogenase family protein [Ottowia sp.]MBK6614263.1 zinc-dependent alcohol dehydrogenase family protein [Ottowia sp.]MBK6745179.1 zinc-dependent alcohol dehydrogenase family protein [Ottowia sp.]
MKLESHGLAPLAANSVRIRMTARAINPSDLITISGAYRSRTQLPFLPGFEGVGVVEELGAQVSGIAKGARVIPIGSAGAWQDVKDSEAAWCLQVPDGVDDEQAAMSYVNPMTAWGMLHEVAKVRPGMRIAVTAAGSAIGQMIVKLANIAGLRPIALLRSERAKRNLAGLSADLIQYAGSTESLHGSDVSAPVDKVDAIFDCVGGQGALPLTHLLRHNGMFIHYGLLSGQPIPSKLWSERPDIDFQMFHLRSWIREIPFEKVQATYAQVGALIANGEIRSNIRSRYRLNDVKAALRDASNPLAEGKVLIAP